jgi:hypothetical protein
MFDKLSRNLGVALLVPFVVMPTLSSATAMPANGDPAQKVNPFIGTGRGPGDGANLFRHGAA